MVRRKPPAMSYPDWVELQIREAQQRGAFENLHGAGEPIPDIDSKRGEIDWIASYLRKENVDPSVLLPPALILAKEVEDLPERLSRERSEDRVRQLVEELNARIRAARLAPQDGPPVRTRPVDAEAAIMQWRAAHASKQAARNALAAVPAPAPSPTIADGESPRRRRPRWGRRRAQGNGAHGSGAHGSGAHGNGAHGNGAHGNGAHGTGA